MRARRVAVLADVHGNAVALAAVLAELEREQPDAIVHCGDLTWGFLPGETLDLLAGLDVLFVRGNADRSVTELAERLQDPAAEATPRERWMVAQHDAPLCALLIDEGASAVGGGDATTDGRPLPPIALASCACLGSLLLAQGE